MKTSQCRRAVKNRCVFSARLKALSDRFCDHSAGGRRFHGSIIDRSYTTFYQSGIVSIALFCTIFEIFDVEEYPVLEIC